MEGHLEGSGWQICFSDRSLLEFEKRKVNSRYVAPMEIPHRGSCLVLGEHEGEILSRHSFIGFVPLIMGKELELPASQ